MENVSLAVITQDLHFKSSNKPSTLFVLVGKMFEGNKRKLESVNRRGTDYIMVKRKRTNNDLQNHIHFAYLIKR
jgi:hypothetical protein